MVSIIIPIYNAEKYLEKCFQSVINQTYKNYEVIAINDGSTDGSNEIILKYANQFGNQLQIVEKKNGGLSSARNAGLGYVRKKYVTFLDADDYIKRDYIEKLVETAECLESDVVCSGQYKVNEEEKILKEIKYNTNNGKCLMRRLNISGKIYKKEYLDKWNLRFPEGKTYEDNPFNLQALFISDKNYFIDYVGYYQVVHEGSITSKSIKVTSLPTEEIENGIKRVIEKNLNDNNLMLFEFTVLSFFTYFLFIRNRKREYLNNLNKKENLDGVLKIARYCENVVNKFFVEARSNKYASLFSYSELGFLQRVGVKVFAWLCYLKKLEQFTKLFYKIAG